MKWKISPFVECFTYIKNEVRLSAAEMLCWYFFMLVFCLVIGAMVYGAMGK